VTEIEIRDPDPQPGDPPGPDPGAAGQGEEPAATSPYKNLLVPLVVVPALITMVLVLIVVLFGLVTGEENTPRENLDRLLTGGANERRQAEFSLVNQVLEYRRARAEGEQPAWDIDESLLPALSAASEDLGRLESAGDVPRFLVLSSLRAQLGDPGGIDQLVGLTGLPEALDPEGEYRMYAAWTLGTLGPEMAPPEREQAARTLIGLLESEDPGLVLVALAGLQTLPGPETLRALRGMLTSRFLEQRTTAALSLAALGDDGGADVLREALRLEPYEAERAESAFKWPPQQVSESRRKALEALFERGIELAPEELERLAESDPDPGIRDAVRSRRARTAGQ